MQEYIKIITDTATICIFDPEILRHRVKDTPDWWTISSDYLEEVNNGNILFCGLGSDGYFEIQIHDGSSFTIGNSIRAILRCESGKFYIGPAEMVSGGNLEPDTSEGVFINVAPGNYRITVVRSNFNDIEMALEQTAQSARNAFDKELEILES